MKKLISATLAASLALSLAACGSSASTDSVAASSEAASTESTAASSEAAESTAETSELAGTTLKVAASPTPHAEILNVAKEVLAEQGIDLEVVEFSDYVQPNLVTESGEVDANYFQHTPYLDSFNEENGTHLVSVGAVHYEPFGIYPGKSDDLANIADGATIAVPNDTTNEARALQLLAAQGLITVRDGAGLTATVNDITDNPHNLQIKEIEAAQLPRTVQDVDFAVINGNYAMEAGFSVGTDALAIEDASSEAAQTYANVLSRRRGRGVCAHFRLCRAVHVFGKHGGRRAERVRGTAGHILLFAGGFHLPYRRHLAAAAVLRHGGIPRHHDYLQPVHLHVKPDPHAALHTKTAP